MTTKDFDVLDVRPILARGEEPFGAIMEAKGRLPRGRGLRVIAPFEPVPLYAMFEAEGYTPRARQIGGTEWWIDFHPAGAGKDTSEAEAAAPGTRELDLRHLEPPAPLQKGLEALGRLGRGETLVLHTRFRPVHLFEQIEEGAFDYDCEEVAGNHWATHVWRADEN